MATNKNLFLQSPSSGDIEEIFAQGAAALSSAPVYSQGIGAQKTARQDAPVSTGFLSAVERVLGHEGGYTPSDGNTGAPANFGINQKHNPDLDVKNITKDQAVQRYKTNYWDAIDGDNLPPELQATALDAAVNQGPARAARWIRQSGGDVSKFNELRREHYEMLAQRPEYSRYKNTWMKRLDSYESQADSKAGSESKQQPTLQQQLDQQEPGRYQVLSEEEATAYQRKGLQSSLDGEEAGRYQVLTPEEASAYAAGKTPAQSQGGIGSTLLDIGKMGLGGVYKGVGQAIGGVGEAVKMVGDYTTTPLINAALGTNYRTGNLLEKPADWYREGGERVQSGISETSKQAIKESTPTGDITKPSTWSMGSNWSPRGYAMLGADVLGSMAPVVAASVASGGSAVVGGVVGGAQGGGAAASTARETIDKMVKEGTIADQSAYYRELIAAGNSPQEAAQLTQDAAAQWALLLTAPVSAAGGALTSKIVDPATKIVAGGSLPARIAGRAGLGGLEDGAQEATETVQTQSGINRGAGTNLSVTEGTFGDFVLGALGGGVTGGGAGALSSRDTSGKAQQAQQPAQARQEPTIDVTYTDQQGNTVTEVVPGTPAQPEAAAQPAPAPSGPIGRALEKVAPAAPVQEAAPAPEAAAEPELPRVRITAENGQTMTGFAEHIGEDGSGRVLGDDGQVYQFTPEDGVTITVEGQAKAPRDEPEAQRAATENEADSAKQQPEAAAQEPEAEAEQAQEAPNSEAQASTIDNEKQQPAHDQQAPAATETEADRPLTEWSEQELRDRLRYVTQQAKTNGGWDGRLLKERARVSKEINSRKTGAKNDQQPAANAVPDASVAPASDQAATPVPGDQPARSAPDEVADVRADAGQAASRATEPPVGEVVSGADAAAQPDAALTPTNSLGRTASWVIREKETGNVVMETFDKKKVDALNTDKYEAVPVQQHLGELNKALKAENDPHAGKWFGSREKADAYIAKRKIPDTHEVVQTGKVRFEIKPKAQAEQATQNADGASMAPTSTATETVAESTQNTQVQAQGETAATDADLDAMFDEAVAAKKQADAKPAQSVRDTYGELEAMAEDAGEGFKTNDRAIAILRAASDELTPPLKAKVTRAINKYTKVQKDGARLVDERLYTEVADIFSGVNYMVRDAIDAQAAPVAPKAKKQPAPAARKEPRQGSVGMKLEAGEQVRTSSGRETTPFPKIDTTSKGKTTNTLKRVDQWLMQNALDEATARGDDFNARQFEANKDKPSQADKDSAEEYLFGEQPAVAPSILRPLGSAAKNTAAGLTAAIDGLGELFGGTGKLNSGLTFDEETYAKAKPLFKQAISHLGEAGRDLRQAMQAIVNMVMDKFGEEATQRMRPYVVQFVKDVRDGKESATENEAASAEPASASAEDAAPIKDRADALAKQFAKAKDGQMALKVEPVAMPDGADGLRFNAVDKDGQKVGKTQLVRASLPDSEIEALMQRFAQDVATTNARMNQPKTPRSEVVKGAEDATGASGNLERRGGQPATEPVLAEGDGDATGEVRPSDSDGGRPGREADQGQQGGAGVPADRAPVHGDGSFVGVHRGDGAAEFAAVASGADFRERGSGIGDAGVPPEPFAAEASRPIADSPAKQRDRRSEQRQADGVKTAPGIENIRATLPALLPGQQDDVAKTEARFAKPTGYGMLLTNGTGTGKTYSGLGVAKRFDREGKGNILVVVPDEKVGNDWAAAAGDLLLNATMLPDTKSAGTGMVVTTYANLGQNNALASREWDLVIADEAHKLTQGKDGGTTAALDNLRAITYHPDGAYTRYAMENAADIERLQAMVAKQQAKEKPDAALGAKIDALEAKLNEKRKEVQARVQARQGAARTRMLALSATPFAYEKSVEWAQGYLFEYPKAEGRGYNSGNGQQQFMMQHFGYTMRYNKLTEPDAKVDRGLMQRNFNTWLKREGALSGRVLDVDQDYDRRFVLVDSKVGNRIDEAFKWFDEQRRASNGEDGRVWSELSTGLNNAFDYLSRRYLLEAIKAKESIPYVKGQLALGRKVVVFHDYKKGGGFNPFSTFARTKAPATLSQSEAAAFDAGLAKFREEFSDLVGADWASYGSAASAYREAFGDNVLVVNGDEKARDNLARYKKFQDDASGPQVILVQSAKNAGWSGHDTTGKHQRVLLNLGLPTAPIMAIQQEGRIYRTGQASNAIMRYMNTGTSWEKTAFAATIAGRASTAENLGMGEDARALKDSFIAAFEESDAYPPGHEGEGTGGKERDRVANAALTEYDRAKAYYWATQKKNSKTKAQEGKDYFATPEPLGQKMVQWADARGGEKVLEPSAGHGAIARWFGENVERTVVEPSTELRARLSLVIDPANDRVVAANFEDLSASNKYDAIAMNPPFGTAGRTAIDHLAKAANHLRERGRVVAIIPTGPAADKKFDAWLYEQNDKGESVHGNLHLVADIKLPQSAFERAGTNVAARVVVIDKVSDPEAAPRQTRNIDLSDAKDISEFFDRLEGIDLPARAVVEQQQEAAPNAPTQTEQPNRGTATTQVQDGDVRTEHVTGKGKTLRGIVRTGVTQEQAKAIDPYTFKKDGGWFIREKYLDDAPRYSIAAGVDRAQVVPVASIESFDVAPEALYETATEWFRENLTGVKVRNESIGADVSFSRLGRGKLTSVGRRDARRMSVVQALPELVKNGVLVEEEGDRKGRYGLDGYATLVAPVEVDGVPYAVSIKVRRESRETNPATIFYTVAAFNLEGASDGGVEPLTPTGDAHSSVTLQNDGGATAVNEPGAAAAPSTDEMVAASRASTTRIPQDRPSTDRLPDADSAGVRSVSRPGDQAAQRRGITVGELLDAINEANRAFSVAASPAGGRIVMNAQQNSNAINAQSLRVSLTSGELGGVVADLLDSGSVVLHDTASSVPVDNMPAGVQAVTTSDGKIHLVAGMLTPRTAMPVLLHEAFHGGVQGLIGTPAWDGLMQSLGAIHRQAEQSSGRAREFYDAARRSVASARRTGTLPESLTAEEFGAYTIEHYDQAPAAFRKWVDDVIGAVKAWLLRRFGLQAGAVTPAQLRALAVAALRDQAQGVRADARYSLSDKEKAQELEQADAELATPRNERIGSIDADISFGARKVVYPRTTASLHKEFTPVYETGVAQQEARDAHIADLGAGMNAYNALKPEQKLNVNKVLELGRLTANTYTAEQLRDGVANEGVKKRVSMTKGGKPKVVQEEIHAELTGAGEVVQLSDAEIKAYTDLRAMFDKALDKFRDQTLIEFGHADLAGQPDPAKKLDEQAKTANGAAKERLQNVANFIRDIEQAKRTGYVPFTRYGDYYVTVKEQIADLSFAKDGDDAYIVTGVTPDMEADVMALGGLPEGDSYVIPANQKQAVQRLAEKTVYSTKVETNIGDMIAIRNAKKSKASIESIPSVKAAIEKARKEWVGNNPKRRLIANPVIDIQSEQKVDMAAVDALAQMAQLDNANWDEIRSQLATAMQARSFRKHFFNSDNVPGYSGDFERSMADYVIGMSGYLSRRAHVKDWDKHIEAIKRKPELRKYAERYRDYVNSPQEEFAALRQAGFGMYIAGVPATAFANLTQVPLLTVPTLSQVAPVPLVMAEVARAYKDAFAMVSRKNGLDMFDPNKAPEDVRDIVKKGWADGSFVPLESFDMMMTARQRNVGRRKLVKGFNDAVKVAAVFFSFAERLNRLVTFMAAARLSEKAAVRKNAEARLGRNALVKQTVLGENWNAENFAKWAVDETQYRMGKANRPEISRGVGAAIMQFKGFMMQTLEVWYRMATQHGKQGRLAMAASLLALYTFSGFWGMPGADDLRKVIEASYRAITDKDLDLKTELRAFVARTTGSNVLAQATTKGLSYPLGVDLTRVGMGTIFPDNAMSAAGIPVDMVLGRPVRAFGKASSGDYAGAVGELSPNFVKNWAIAGGWAADGVRDKSGQRILAPEHLSGSDLTMKAMGFQPSIVTDVRDYEYAQRRQETAVDGLKRKWTAEIARTLVAIERAEEAGDAKKAASLTEDLDEVFSDIDAHNEKAAPEEQIKIGQQAVRNRMARERGGVMQTWGKERKQAREGAEGLRDLFGLSEE